MWKYIRPYLPYAVFAALCMVGEVSMDLLQPDIMSRLVDDGVLGISSGGVSDLNMVLRMGAAMLGIALLGCVFGSTNNVFVQYAGQSVGNDMRKDCFKNILRFSFPQVERFGTGSLITRVTNDITQVQGFVSMFVRGLIRTSLLTIGSVFFLFKLNTMFGLISLCAAPLVLLIIIISILKTNPLFPKLQQKLDNINSIMQEDISGIRVIKACVREVYEKIRFGKANDELIKTQLKILIIFAFMSPLMNMLLYGAIVLILYSGNAQVMTGTASPGAIMAAITYATQLLNGILMLVMLFQTISRGYASWKRVREVLNSEPDLKDGDFDGRTELRGSVEFKGASFAFPDSDKNVLDSISLKIDPGETIAIMGATGCGKTSLVSLIPRFYDAIEGAVLVDGVDVKKYNQTALRQKISVALQKSELFSVPIKENIAWGRPNASDDEIIEAARIAQAHDFIMNTPDGYDTMVAERGTSLSGGQRQRVAIARAVLSPAEILIFDDATSALDLKTEADLYAALKKHRPDMTKIIVVQRIASARFADRIAVLEHGVIAACGSHEELLKTSDTYRDIYRSQMSDEESGVSADA